MHASIFGLIVADLIAEPMDLRRPPAPGGLVPLNSLRLVTGGNVCNTGIAMAKLIELPALEFRERFFPAIHGAVAAT